MKNQTQLNLRDFILWCASYCSGISSACWIVRICFVLSLVNSLIDYQALLILLPLTLSLAFFNDALVLGYLSFTFNISVFLECDSHFPFASAARHIVTMTCHSAHQVIHLSLLFHRLLSCMSLLATLFIRLLVCTTLYKTLLI